MTRRRRTQAGFTLIELMVSLVLFAFVTAGMLSVAITMARGFREQESTITTESATRSTLDFLAEAVRAGSPGVELGNITSPSCSTSAISIVNNDGTIPSKPTTHNSDRLTLVYPAGWVFTALDVLYTKGDSSMTLAHSGNQLANGDQLLVTDFTQGHIVTLNAAPTGNVVNFAADACAGTAYSYPRGTVVIRVRRSAFYIQMLPGDALNDSVPALMMDPTPEDLSNGDAEPIAEGVEDLQVAVAIDANNDGVITEIGAGAGDDEWNGNFIGEAIPATLTGARAIRVSIVARATRAAQGINFFQLGALEDRLVVATNDGFRRRMLSTIVEIRNLDGSP